ncbi:MAG TPA: hypothetical protein VGD27_10690 [Longimicrobiales bacterium]
MELFFSILLGLVALWALYSALKGARAAAIGYVIVALAAIGQIININGQYSLIFSIVTTLALIIGIVLARRPGTGASTPNP